MSFYSDLKFGQDAEQRLQAAYPCLTFSIDRSYDFLITGTNIRVEKKSDSYHPAKYSNFIIERFSKEEKPGGPWQSKLHKCRYYIYMFAQTNDIYVFDVVQLIARVKKLIKKHNLKLYDRWNPTYITRYYKIPIVQLLDLNVGMAKLTKLSEQALARKAKAAAKRKQK